MTQEERDKINAERLTDWGIELAHSHSTAALMVGVGHDERSGELHVCVPANLPTQVLIGFLERALVNMRRGDYRRLGE